ncbi:hypothetical protein ACFL5U_00270 [Candidatus Margulisiibacteriota bacterium]
MKIKKPTGQMFVSGGRNLLDIRRFELRGRVNVFRWAQIALFECDSPKFRHTKCYQPGFWGPENFQSHHGVPARRSPERIVLAARNEGGGVEGAVSFRISRIGAGPYSAWMSEIAAAPWNLPGRHFDPETGLKGVGPALLFGVLQRVLQYYPDVDHEEVAAGSISRSARPFFRNRGMKPRGGDSNHAYTLRRAIAFMNSFAAQHAAD